MHPNTRVRLRGAPSGVTLTGDTGTVIGPDPRWPGYVLVRLDAPAWEHATDGSAHELWELREAPDNLEPL